MLNPADVKVQKLESLHFSVQQTIADLQALVATQQHTLATQVDDLEFGVSLKQHGT